MPKGKSISLFKTLHYFLVGVIAGHVAIFASHELDLFHIPDLFIKLHAAATIAGIGAYLYYYKKLRTEVFNHTKNKSTPKEQENYFFKETHLLELMIKRAVTNSHSKFSSIESDGYILDSLTDPFLILTEDGYIQFGNKAACKLFEKDKYALSRTHSDHLLGFVESSSGETMNYVTFIKKWGYIDFEKEITTENGNVLNYQMNGSIGKDDKTGQNLYYISFSDISGTKQAESKLQKNESRFRTVFENSMDGLIITDETFKIVEFNDRLSEITEIQKAILGGASVLKILNIASESVERAANEKEQTILSNIPIKGKGDKSVEVHVSKFTADNRTYFTFSTRDITQKLSNERIIRMLARLPAENPEPVLRINTEGRVRYANPAATSLIAMTFENDSRTPPLSWLKNIEKANETKESLIVNEEYSGVKYRLIFNPSRDDDYVNIYAQDITAIEEANTKITEQQALLAATSKLSALGEMAGGIAHEINNPLAIIKAASEDIRDFFESDFIQKEHVVKNIDMIEKMIYRMTEIIAGLRTLSRDARHDDFRPADLKRLVLQTIAFCKQRLYHANIEVETDFDGNCEIDCRATEISQVLLNLIINAKDAIEESKDPWIKVKTIVDTDSNLVTIEVIDSGLGIEASIGEKILQPFFTTKSPGKGTGLGLSVSSTIMSNHQGELYIDHGRENTTFVLKLPIKQNDQDQFRSAS